MEVACDCDAMEQIELTTQKSQAELEAQKRSIFSTQKSWSFGTHCHASEHHPTYIEEVDNEWKPKFLQYCKESDRLVTFATWPKQMNPKPEKLAKAGFFYEGVSDTCQCFHCRIITFNWEVKDDPIQEHYKHSWRCHFVEYLM